LLTFNYGKSLREDRRNGGSVAVYGSNGIVGRHDTSLTQAPAIIVGRKGSVGQVHYSGSACWPIDTAYFIDEFHELAPRYVFYALRFLRLSEQEKSSAIPGLSRDDAYDRTLSIAPVLEQKRIVAKIDALLACVNAARERIAKLPTILKRFRQSVLAAACSGRLTSDWRESHPDIEPSSELLRRITGRAGFQSRLELPEIPDCWVWAALPWLGELNRGKSRHRPRNASHLFGGPYPFLQTGDVARSGGRIRSHSQTYGEEGLKQSRLWPAGTVCITIAANIADSGILTYKACFPDSVVGFIADSRLCSPELVEFFIRTARENLSAFASETTQKNINLEILREVAVPVPPLKEQREIVRCVEMLFKLADAIEKRVAAATARAEKLKQSILAKAFRGELVPTEAELARRDGWTYEPASALLGRIKSEENSPVTAKQLSFSLQTRAIRKKRRAMVR
jgi:type I restriction enzyme S subunit